MLGCAANQFRARPDSVCVRHGLAGWGGRIRTSAFQNRNSPRLSALGEDSHLRISNCKCAGSTLKKESQTLTGGRAPRLHGEVQQI
jgi:hypothetical protein